MKGCEGDMDSEDAIKREYKAGELESIYAIGRLEQLGLASKEAELRIEQWDSDLAHPS